MPRITRSKRTHTKRTRSKRRYTKKQRGGGLTPRRSTPGHAPKKRRDSGSYGFNSSEKKATRRRHMDSAERAADRLKEALKTKAALEQMEQERQDKFHQEHVATLGTLGKKGKK